MLKTLLAFCSAVSLFLTVSCQEWSWIWGSDTVGAMATPDGPGSRSGSSVWTDIDGKVWMFGGKGFTDIGRQEAKLLNDLWWFDMNTKKWHLENEGSVSRVGTDEKMPSPRQLAAVCGVSGVTLAVFGGLDEKDAGLKDTWVYDIQKKKWLALSELTNYTAVTNNHVMESPSARGDMAVWCRYDSMFIFGGMDQSDTIYNDMWKLSLRDLGWSRMESSLATSNDSEIYPTGRNGATTWLRNETILYMFGGNIKNTNIRSRILNFGYVSDMWKYFVTNDTWVFINGYRSECKAAVYGTKQHNTGGSRPGCRRRAAAWTDTNLDLWMFGGDGTDDAFPSVFHTSKLLEGLWYFNTKWNTWVWYGGGIHDAGKEMQEPGGRYEPIFWTGPANKFYLMGGRGHDNHKHDGYLNDVWMLDLDSIVNSTGVSGGKVILFLLLAVALVLLMSGIFLYARDRRGVNVWSRFDRDVKYSQLTTDAD